MKDLKEFLKKQEQAAIKAIVSAASSAVKSKGISLKSMLDKDAKALKNYTSTYKKNIADGLEGQAAKAASDFLTQLPKPNLQNPIS
ncbi:Uncharacterised protein [Streptococcus macacae NCTC 11558]|uniref:Uncharacterized protein n=1 Tax=Streptococcus macacae NCTC 11558 TaxID=764298 RepID=G5JXW3_9STRE|nr:hypothetical protein [Streptococcus macacae]EHJ52843.1 hypothetical protein STRMA_0008 [Streptococcus macacae NCTC 11558]SUN77885.1 Uncharacterised protein [Streptococcus macacae NCTC 11558]